MKEYPLFINGQLTPAKENKFFDTINPSTGEVFARIADAGIEDMQQAIQAARNAFDNGPWGTMTPAERGIYLKKIAKLVRQHAKELADIELNDTGKTSKQATFIDVPTCADAFDAFSNFAHALEGQSNPVNMPVDSRTIHEPFGVVGCIVPWNYPLIYIGWKMAPALMAGNTIVYKPSPLASASTLRFAEIIKDVGLPEGVINIVSTNRTEVAEELVRNPAVDMISFTGGTETGKHIIKTAAETVKKVSPELGGKSPNIVLADCDRQAALGGTLTSIFMNQGQMCTAGSRLLLEDAIYDEFLTELIKKTKTLKIGPAHETGTAFGPVISREHRDKVLQAIDAAVKDGAKLECGGTIPEGEQFKNGFFVEPAILSGVTNDMAIAREEVFGPVLAVMKFSGIDEAIKIANDSDYGLAACVWTMDEKKSAELSRRLKSGTVWVNTYGGFYNEASFGGYKQSGFGRELGANGLLEYTQSKHICIDKTPGGVPLVSAWF